MLRYWLFVVLTLLVTGVVGYATFATSRLLRSWKPTQNPLLLLSENGIRLVLLLAFILFGFLSSLPQVKLGWVWDDLLYESAVGITWGVAIALFFFGATKWLVQQGVGGRIYSTVIIEAILPRSFKEALLVAVAMIPAVVSEELLFRSLLLGGFSPLAPPLLLLVVSSIVFGLLHSSQGIWGMVGASVGGFLFGILFLWRGTIVTPVIAHYVANMLQICIAVWWFEPEKG
ncbi:MAG: type II CAAX endopeptidase family protein [Chloroflexota bacterium]